MGVALGADMFDCVWPTRTAVRLVSLSDVLQLIDIALRKRRGSHRYIEPATPVFRRGLPAGAGGLHLQHLSTEGAGRTGHYASIPAPFGGEGDRGSASVSCSAIFPLMYTNDLLGLQCTTCTICCR